MRKEDLIELGLTEEQADKVLDGFEGYVPKPRFKELIDEKNRLKEELKDRDKQLEDLKNSSSDAEAMKAQIENLQAENKKKDEEYIAQINQLKIDAAIDAAIVSAKGKNTKAIKALLDMSKIELDNEGNVVGYDEQLKELVKAEDSKFLFDTETKKTQIQIKGATPAISKEVPIDTDVSKMTYSQMAEYLANNPDAQIK